MDNERNRITVDNLHLSDAGASTEISALLTASHLNWNKKKLWYRFPQAYSNLVTSCFDPFLVALLPLAMKTRSNLILKGAVSERLLINSRQIMKILSGWFDYMEPVDITADSSEPALHGTKAVGSFFTGGVDSFYTVLKNLELYHNESRITHLLYVHGFDIKISNRDLFKKVFKHLKKCGDELGLKLLVASTNLREITDTHISWGKHEYGAALASVGLGLSKLFKTILIPSGHPYATVYPTGIHPLLDPLWSNESTHFMQDGNEADRNQKVAWQLSKSSVALRHLRVCWKNPGNSYNCGKCAKCIRTKINLKLAGALQACRTLDNTIDLELLEKMALNDPKEGRMLKEIIVYLEEQHIHPDLKKQLMLILENTKEKFSLRKKAKKLDQKYLKNSISRLSTYLREK